MKLAHLHHKSLQLTEPIWHVQLAVLVAIGLQISLSSSLIFGPKYIIAGAEVILLFALTIITPRERTAIMNVRRTLAIFLIALISIVNIASLVIVLHALFAGSHITGRELIVASVTIYLTNIIMFGLWYWELDNDFQDEQDFLFPQMTVASEVTGQPKWSPAFFDYLYVSITNGSAFSPTDTMPLTHRAKLLMSSQSMVSLVTVVLVTARAVNILA